MGTSKLVSLTLHHSQYYFRLFHFEGIQNCFSDVVLSNGLLEGFAVIVDKHKFVHEEDNLPEDDVGEGVILSINCARSENGSVRELSPYCLLSFELCLKIEGGRVWISSSGRKVDQPHHSCLFASFSNSFRDVDVHIIKVLLLFVLSSGAYKIDHDVGIFNHILNKSLVSKISAKLHPSFIYIMRLIYAYGQQALTIWGARNA